MVLEVVEELLPAIGGLAPVGQGRRLAVEPLAIDAVRQGNLLKLPRLDLGGFGCLGQGEGKQRLTIEETDDALGHDDAEHHRGDDQQRVGPWR